jgi:hypothetical protein
LGIAGTGGTCISKFDVVEMSSRGLAVGSLDEFIV